MERRERSNYWLRVIFRRARLGVLASTLSGTELVPIRMQSRRSVLTALTAASIGLLVPWGRLQPRNSDRSLAERIAGLFCDQPRARAVGRAHLKSGPGDTGIADVVRRVVRDADQHAHLMRAGDRVLRRFLQARRRCDFESGNTVCINGWVLSETEANLCAVVALLAESQRDNGAVAGSHV
jgi:hypothetical protein